MCNLLQMDRQFEKPILPIFWGKRSKTIELFICFIRFKPVCYVRAQTYYMVDTHPYRLSV